MAEPELNVDNLIGRLLEGKLFVSHVVLAAKLVACFEKRSRLSLGRAIRKLPACQAKERYGKLHVEFRENHANSLINPVFKHVKAL